MPLKKSASKKAFKSNVKELFTTFKKKGKIGTSKPSSPKKAIKQAVAIAYEIKGESLPPNKKKSRIKAIF